MSRTNRKSGLSLTPAVFGALHKALVLALKDTYKVSPETLVDYQLYGFNNFDEDLPSIKKMILDKTEKWVNGKYLYNKYREWKNGNKLIHLTREFIYIYFKALGYQDLNDFMLNSSLSEAAIAEQVGLETASPITVENEYYVGYYIGEEGNTIATRLTLYQESLKVLWELIYWEKEDAYSEYPYEGKILYQQNGMSLLFKNDENDLDRSLFISIFCERHVKIKPFLIGTYSGFDRNRQPVVGEVLFQRVNSIEEQKELITQKQINPMISQYITGKRWLSLGKTFQNLLDLSPESKFASIIEDFIQSYRGTFVSTENGVFVFELEILDNLGNANLRIAGHPIYKGIFKVQASGQLVIGQFSNTTTKAPLFMSIEVLPLREDIFTGDLMGISRFDKSFSGKLYLSSTENRNVVLPKYRGAELSISEIQSLPQVILDDLTQIFEKNKLEKYFKAEAETTHSEYIYHLAGTYRLEYAIAKVKKTAQLIIEDNRNATLIVQHLHHKGTAMMCEGGILSISFTQCNGIAHCGQIMGKVGRKSRKELTKIDAKWFFIDEDFETQVIEVELVVS